MNETTIAVDTKETSETDVELALANGTETKSLAELKDLISQAVDAHRSGEMDAAIAALEAASAMVDVLLSEDDTEEIEIEVPKSDSIAEPETNKDANAEAIASLEKKVAEIGKRMDALLEIRETKSVEDDPFSSNEALERFISKTLGGK